MSSRRRVPLAAVLLAVAVLLTAPACANVSPVALRVGDWELSREDFVEQLGLVAGNESYLQLRDRAGAPLQVAGTTAGTYSSSFVVESLNERVTFRLAADALARRGLEVTEADRDRARLALSQQFGDPANPVSPQEVDPVGLAVLEAFGPYGEVLLEGVAALFALQEALRAEVVSEESLRVLFEERREELGEQACVRHILVRFSEDIDPATGRPAAPTPEQESAALAAAGGLASQLAAGADFAQVAQESSQDPGSAQQGGDLGCASQGTFVAEFDEAVWSLPVGEASDPVRTEFGYHLVLVESRGLLSFDDARVELEALAEQDLSRTFRQELVDAAGVSGVEVDPRFGRWDGEAAQVVAPEGAEPAPTTVPVGVPGQPAPVTPGPTGP